MRRVRISFNRGDVSRATACRHLLAKHSDEASQSLCMLFDLYLSRRGLEEWHVMKAGLSFPRTLAVYVRRRLCLF